MILQQSESIKNGYVLTSPEKGIVIRFIAGRFNETSQVTILDDIEQPSASEIAHYLQEMGDWLAINHPELIIKASDTMYYHAKNSGMLYCIMEKEDGSLFITLDGEHSIPNTGLFVKNLGGVEAVKAKCFRDSRTLEEIREEFKAKKVRVAKAKKERVQELENFNANKAKVALDELIEKSENGIIETSLETLRIVARYLHFTNWGQWKLPKMTIGYSANQYDSGAITILLSTPIEVCGEPSTRFVFGAAPGELANYTHLRF